MLSVVKKINYVKIGFLEGKSHARTHARMHAHANFSLSAPDAAAVLIVAVADGIGNTLKPGFN